MIEQLPIKGQLFTLSLRRVPPQNIGLWKQLNQNQTIIHTKVTLYNMDLISISETNKISDINNG